MTHSNYVFILKKSLKFSENEIIAGKIDCENKTVQAGTGPGQRRFC